MSTLTRTGRQPYDAYQLEDPTGVLSIALGQWEDRDDAIGRQAANTAMETIDDMIRELYAMRARLAGEIRASDDATAARVDELLGNDAA